MKSILKLFEAIIDRIKRTMILRKYNRFTIAELFRQQGAQVGEGCSIIPTSLGIEPYLVKIGNHVTIAQGVTFITHDGATWIFRDEIPDLQVFGPIIIEDNCVVGQNAVLFPNIKIGRNSIVGAGSVVISDITENSIAMGIPARAFGSIEKYKQKCIEGWQVQRPHDIQIDAGEDWWNSKHFTSNREKLRRHLLRIFKNELGVDSARQANKAGSSNLYNRSDSKQGVK